MKLYSPQECMGIWLSQKPVRSGKTIWYSIAKCIECAVNQDEIARELSRIKTDIEKHDEQIRTEEIRKFAEWLPQHFDLRFSNNPDVWIDEFFNHTRDKTLSEYKKEKK